MSYNNNELKRDSKGLDGNAQDAPLLAVQATEPKPTYAQAVGINLTDPIYKPITAQTPSAPEPTPFSAKARKQQGEKCSHAGVNRNDDTTMSDLGLALGDVHPSLGDDRHKNSGNNNNRVCKCSRNKPCRKCRNRRLRKPTLPSKPNAGTSKPNNAASDSKLTASGASTSKTPNVKRVSGGRHCRDSEGEECDYFRLGPSEIDKRLAQLTDTVCSEGNMRGSMSEIRYEASDALKASDELDKRLGSLPVPGGSVARAESKPAVPENFNRRPNTNADVFGPVVSRLPEVWNVGKIPSSFDTNLDYNINVGRLSAHTSDVNHAHFLSPSRMVRDGRKYDFGDALADFYDYELMSHLLSVKPVNPFVPKGSDKRTVIYDYLTKEMERYFRARNDWSGQMISRSQVVVIDPVTRSRRQNTVRLATDAQDNDYLAAYRPPPDRWQGHRLRNFLRGVRSSLRAFRKTLHRSPADFPKAPEPATGATTSESDRLLTSHAQRGQKLQSFLTRVRSIYHWRLWRIGNAATISGSGNLSSVAALHTTPAHLLSRLSSRGQ